MEPFHCLFSHNGARRRPTALERRGDCRSPRLSSVAAKKPTGRWRENVRVGKRAEAWLLLSDV